MTDEQIRSSIKILIANYLSLPERGPWTVHNACITAVPVRDPRLPADAKATSLEIKEPDADWSVDITVVHRDGKLWRLEVEDLSGNGAVRAAFCDWLGAL